MSWYEKCIIIAGIVGWVVLPVYWIESIRKDRDDE